MASSASAAARPTSRTRPVRSRTTRAAICEENGVEYVELQVANDALTVVVNPENDWATCLTVEELNAMWKPGSTVELEGRARRVPGRAAQALRRREPTRGRSTTSPTSINGEEGASRTDYPASEDDNVIVQGVKGTTGGLGYFGFSYFEENQDTLKAVEIDGG